jgi:hypothetical protein
MIYVSKGLSANKAKGPGITISHCGALHDLAGVQACLWLAGRRKPFMTRNQEMDGALQKLAGLGVVEICDAADDISLFRMLTNCVICPVRRGSRFVLLNKPERRVLKWVGGAGLRLTIAELTLLEERGVLPAPGLLGQENRQALTETIYTADTIPDGILETLMEGSPALDATVQCVLGLLRKEKIYLI